MKEVDIFTTAKPFVGTTRIHQENALRSWRAEPCVGRILVFGTVSGDVSVLAEVGAEVIVDVNVTGNGLPSVKSMFERAAAISDAGMLMFSNADMVFLPSFFEEAVACGRSLAGTGFLLVGSRMDFDCDRIFGFRTGEDLDSFRVFAGRTGKMHPPMGSDFFIFPRNQYLVHELPELWVGRGGWDLYMILHARGNGIQAVDLTPSSFGYHQNHDYSIRGAREHIGYRNDPEANFNLSLLPEGIPWDEWALQGCQSEWREKRLVPKPPIVRSAGVAKRAPAARPAKPAAPPVSFPRRLARALLRRIRRRPARPPAPGAVQPAERRKAGAVPEIPADGPIRIIVGAGGTKSEGWVSTDIDHLNLLSSADWEELLRGRKVSRVLAEHVWEHLGADDGLVALKNVFAHLESGGRIRIAVPDGQHPDPAYLEHVKPGGTGPGADDHKVLYTCATLCGVLRDAGFEPVPLEFWSEDGEFKAVDWSPEDGRVRRSFRNDPRNGDGRPNYTSLIVDGVKKS